MVRVRTRYLGWHDSGFAKSIAVGAPDLQQDPISRGFETCSDENLTPGSDHALNIERVHRIHGYASGKVGFAYNASDWAYAGGTLNHASGGSLLPSVTDTFIRHQAWTNPSQPKVDLPISVFELKDLPGMIWGIGFKQLLRFGEPTFRNKGGGGSVVDYNFGWDLLISDLKKLVNIVPQIDARFKALKSSMGASGYNPKPRIWRETNPLASWIFYPFSEYSGAYRVQFEADTHRMRWASLRWKTNAAELPDSDDALYAKARDLTLGLKQNITVSTLWNAMPWSWFIDYFANVGDVLAASRNAIGSTTTNRCVMTYTRTGVAYVKDINNPWGATFAAAPCFRETKNRVVAPGLILPEVRLPVLSSKQVLTLASISHNRSRWFK